MTSLRFASHNLVELRGPVLQTDGSVVTTGTCLAWLFDDHKDTKLRAAAASPDTVLSVADASRWAVGDQALVWLDTYTWHDGGLVTAVSVSDRTITITNAIASAASIGRRVCAALGNGGANTYRLTMSPFNAAGAVSGTYDWGWRGTLPPNHPKIEIGRKVRIEIELVGPSAILVEIVTAYVTGGS